MESNPAITGISAHHLILVGAIKRNGERYLELVSDEQSHAQRDETDEIATTLVILISTYIEALINIYLSIRLSEPDFEKLERSGVMTKWEVYPKLVSPTYSLDRDLKKSLEAMKARRDKIIHFKPEVVIDGNVKTKGRPVRVPINDIDNVIDWLRLPDKLIKNLHKHDNSNIFIQYHHLCHVQILYQFRNLLTKP